MSEIQDIEQAGEVNISVKNYKNVDKKKLHKMIRKHQENFEQTEQPTDNIEYMDVQNTFSHYQQDKIKNMIKDVQKKAKELSGEDGGVNIDDCNYETDVTTNSYRPSKTYEKAYKHKILKTINDYEF